MHAESFLISKRKQKKKKRRSKNEKWKRKSWRSLSSAGSALYQRLLLGDMNFLALLPRQRFLEEQPQRLGVCICAVKIYGATAKLPEIPEGRAATRAGVEERIKSR